MMFSILAWVFKFYGGDTVLPMRRARLLKTDNTASLNSSRLFKRGIGKRRDLRYYFANPLAEQPKKLFGKKAGLRLVWAF